MPMAPNTVVLLVSALLFCLSAGCTPRSGGGVFLRADGSPGPQACPEKSLETMRILRLHVGASADVELDVNQTDDSPITLYEGHVESMLTSSFGHLPPVTRLYGYIWTGGPQVVIRYYEARPPEEEAIPICAVARLARGQLKKRPESKPGTAIVEFSSAAVYIVDAFR